MRFVTIALSFFAARAVAITDEELANKIPACARGCLEEGWTAVGCDFTDFPCQCDNQRAVFNTSLPCINAKCTTMREHDLMAGATTFLCMSIAQQANPNWTGPPITDSLPPILLE